MIDHMLGHYRILEKIGSGGMGEVYRAGDERLERDLAIKVLPAGTLTDQAARTRFRKEALALARLNHPNIGVVYEFDTQGETDFLVLEYIGGTSLATQLTSGALPEKEAVKLGQQVAAALEEAHERGVIHRDLRPGNILVTPKRQAKVVQRWSQRDMIAVQCEFILWHIY
jgi:serine/threonine protein kinase